MTYPPAGGTPDPYQAPDPYQPSDPYQQSQPPPSDPTLPYPPASPGPFSGSGYPPPPPYGAPGHGPQPGYPPPPDKSPFGAPGYGAPYSPYGPQNTNALAIASLVCSIAGVVTCISAPVGIVLGHLAKKQIRETHESGEGLATAGLWVGYLLTIIGLVLGVIWVAAIIFAINNGDTTTF